LFELFFKYSRATFERGELLFASGWPVWLLVAAIAVGAVAVGIGLARNNQGLGIAKVATLGVLQTLLWAVVLTMLWQPVLVTQTLRPQENSVAVLLDASASMGYGEGSQSRLQQAVEALEERVLPELDAAFDVELRAFADDTLPLESLAAVPAPGPTTDIGSALLSVLRGANAGALAAIVLVSDGADTTNELDAARIAEIASFGVPVHALGVGAEQIEDDLELDDVVVAPQSMPGSTVSAQVSLRHAQGALAQLKVYDGDAILASTAIQLPNQAGVTTRWIDIDVGEAGIRDLRFTLDAGAGETNVVNNTQRRPMEVPQRRRHILYIEGEPRWEYKFLRRAIDEEGPLRVASLLRTTPNKFYRQGVESAEELADGFPTDEQTLFAYDAILIGSFEAAALTLEQQAMLVEFVSRRGGSLLMLGGRRGLADGGWGLTALADVLPASLPEVDAASFMRQPAKALLTPVGRRSLLTRLAADDAENLARWDELPELADFQYLEGLKPGAEVLLEADIEGTAWPLLVHQRYGQGNSYILATGGTWRWQMQLPHEDQRHETFWRQLLQALAAAAPEHVMLSTDRVFYADTSSVTLRADVRDKDFRPADGASVRVTVDTGTGAATALTMEAAPGQPGRYEVDFDAAAPGIYRFEATAELAGELLGSSRLAVRREDGVAEHFRIQQNRPLLERLAGVTGGRYFALADAGSIPEAVQFSDAGVVERRVLELWNMPINFLLLLLLKAGEWLLRLRWGRL
jgi:uncharacterized membrane protein